MKIEEFLILYENKRRENMIQYVKEENIRFYNYYIEYEEFDLFFCTLSLN